MAKTKTPEKLPFVFRAGEVLDKGLSIIAPGMARKRSTNRRFAFSVWYGADKSGTHRRWNPKTQSADADNTMDRATLVARSRSLIRDNGYAAGLKRSLVSNIIGRGLKPQSDIAAEILGLSNETYIEKLQTRMEWSFKTWDRHADATERQTFRGIQQQVMGAIYENGESLVIRRSVNAPWKRFTTALQVIDPDRLGTPNDKRNDKNIVDGVEKGENGEPIAYWIKKTPIGSVTLRTTNTNDYERIPARDDQGRQIVFHLFPAFQSREGQTRGVPWVAPVIAAFHDLGKYLEYELVAAKVASAISLWIKSTDPEAEASASLDSDETDADGTQYEELEGGTIRYLNKDEEPYAFNPNRPGDTFAPFMEILLRLIAAGAGATYESVARDFSKTNYSSARAAMLEARREYRMTQSYIEDNFLQPIWEIVIEEAFLRGKLGVIPNFYEFTIEYTNAQWTPDGWEWVDPLRSVKASIASIEADISTKSDEITKLGGDPDAIRKQRKREKLEAAKVDAKIAELVGVAEGDGDTGDD